MNKTLTYVLIVIGAYLLIIFPKINSKKEEKAEEKTEEPKADTKSGTGLNENADKNGVSQGPAGQQKYRIGYVK